MNKMYSLLMPLLVWARTLGVFIFLLFFSAETFEYVGAWVFIVEIFVPILCLAMVMWNKNRRLLERRLEGGEKEFSQIISSYIGSALTLAGVWGAGKCYKSKVFFIGKNSMIIGSTLYIFSCLVYYFVVRDNPYLFSVLKVEKKQSVISKGLYGVIRHPMYLATALLYASAAFTLNCLITALLFVCFIPILVVRINTEEKILKEQLIGYEEYMFKVKYRLIPFIW